MNSRLNSLHTKRALIAAFLAVAATASTTLAVQPGRWTHTTEADFSAGKPENVVVTNLGDLKLAAGNVVVGQIPEQATIIYSIRQLADGDIILATGPQAKLLRRRGEQITEIVSSADQQIFCMEIDAQGRLIVGLSGNKSSLAVLEGDKLRTLVELPETRYVWDMVLDGKTAYLATGTEGRLLRVNLDGGDDAVQSIFDAKQANLLCLGRDGQGRLYVGTDTDGLVYRIIPKPDGGSDVFVLFDAPEPEVGALLVLNDGTVFVGTADADQARPGRLSEAATAESGRVQPSGAGEAGEKPAPIEPGELPQVPPKAPPIGGSEGGSPPTGEPGGTAAPKAPADRKSNDSSQTPSSSDDSRMEMRTGVQSNHAVVPNVAFAGATEPVTEAEVERALAIELAETKTAGDGNNNSAAEPTPEQRDRLREVIRQRLEQARKTGTLQAEPSRPSGPRKRIARPASGPASGPAAARPGGPGDANKPGNAVYRIEPSGFVNEVFRESVMILRLLDDHGSLLVATGNEGLIFRVDPAAEETTVIADLEPQQVPTMLIVKGQPAAKLLPALTPASQPATAPAPATPTTTTKPAPPPTTAPAEKPRKSLFGSRDKSKDKSATADNKSLAKDSKSPTVSPNPSAPTGPVPPENPGQEYIMLGSANPASLVRLDRSFARTGTYTSPVLDASQISLWGRVNIVFDTPQGTSLKLETRSGNVRNPEQAAWSEWSEPLQLQPSGVPLSPVSTPITSPPARFLQYRLTFSSTGNGTAVVDRVDATYVTPNLKPSISSVRGSYPGQGGNGGPTPPGRPGGPPPAAASAGGDNDEQPPANMNIEWEASDPNGDRLRYTLEYRAAGGDKWLPLAEDVDPTNHEWQTRRVPDGRYVLRVTATDKLDNPPGMVKTATRISDPVVIDNTPPEFAAVEHKVEGKGKAAKVTIKLTVKDAMLPIRAVGYAVDQTKNYEPALPNDLIFDSTEESLTITISDLSPGPHVATLRASDQRGNLRHRAIQIEIPQ